MTSEELEARLALLERDIKIIGKRGEDSHFRIKHLEQALGIVHHSPTPRPVPQATPPSVPVAQAQIPDIGIPAVVSPELLANPGPNPARILGAVDRQN